MTKKIRTPFLPLLIGFISLLTLSSWFFGLVAPVDEYEDLICNKYAIDSTIGATNSYDETDYEACIEVGESFTAGDKLYRFVVSDTDTFVIHFEVLDTSNLQLFLMENAIDPETDTDCPGACIDRLDGTSELGKVLLPGIYWLSVDGMISSTGPEQGDGNYSLVIECDNAYSAIECGQIVSDQTTGWFSNFNILNYGGCFEDVVNPYDAPDRIYRFEILEKQTVTIDLEKFDNQELHLFLLDDAINIETGEVFPGFCIGKSDLGAATEQIVGILDIGIYFIVVDGTDFVMDGPIFNTGSYNLSLTCQNDYESIACGDLVMGNTADRVSYNASMDYADCSPAGDYIGGDATYLFQLDYQDDLTFILSPTEGDNLDLILARATRIPGTMKFALDSCLAISDTSTTAVRERIIMTLDSGSYFIIVDGALMPNDTAAAGPYMLEVKCASLPIELVSFTGVPVEEGVQLDWVTASEVGFEGFYLQRSVDGTNWNNLGWQAAKGSPQSLAEYRFMDKEPVKGANYYRLRSVDLDGTVNISSIVQVNYTGGGVQSEFSIYPTLASDWLKVQGVESGTPVRYEIRTPLGQLLLRGRIGDSDETLDISGLSSGMLYMTLNDGARYKTVAFRKI